MAHARTVDDDLLQDREVRDSIMIIRRQRNTKLIAAILGMIGFAVLAGVAVYYAYASEMDATKDLPMLTQQ